MRSNSIDRMEGIGILPPPPPSLMSEGNHPLRHGMGPLNAMGESHSMCYDRKLNAGKKTFMGFDSSKYLLPTIILISYPLTMQCIHRISCYYPNSLVLNCCYSQCGGGPSSVCIRTHNHLCDTNIFQFTFFSLLLYKGELFTKQIIDFPLALDPHPFITESLSFRFHLRLTQTSTLTYPNISFANHCPLNNGSPR